MILRHNVLHFLKNYDLRTALPYLTFDFIDGAGIYFLADRYFGFSLFSDKQSLQPPVGGGVVQYTHLKRGRTRFRIGSCIPPRQKGHHFTQSTLIKNYMKQVFFPAPSADYATDLEGEMKSIIRDYLPLYRKENDVTGDHLFRFYESLGCGIKTYDPSLVIRDHIGIGITVEESPGPRFFLNGNPITLYTVKADPRGYFADLTFVEDLFFEKTSFLANHTFFRTGNREKSFNTLVVFGLPEKRIEDFFLDHEVFLIQEGWKTLVLFLNSLPLNVTIEFLLNDSPVITRLIAQPQSKEQEK